MPRNLDMTSLRSFLVVSETGGVTRAAGQLNLTQSAVSMQLKRLEESLGCALLDRGGRGIALTGEGEQLASYARRMVALNDEIYTRLTSDEFEGEIVLGVPHDIVYPAIPRILRRFHSEFPRMRVQLLSSITTRLRARFDRGGCDLILTTEDHAGAGAETLDSRRLVWVGAPDGAAWRQRPMPLAFETGCSFRNPVQKALDQAGIPWEMAVTGDSTRTIEATVSADLATHALIEGMTPPYLAGINHGGALPDLREVMINLYVSDAASGPSGRLADLVREGYRAAAPPSQRRPSPAVSGTGAVRPAAAGRA